METKKQRLERLIRDEMNTIEILRDKKKDIERQIDSIADKVSEMRDDVNAL
jgi:phage shock protein A